MTPIDLDRSQVVSLAALTAGVALTPPEPEPPLRRLAAHAPLAAALVLALALASVVTRATGRDPSPASTAEGALGQVGAVVDEDGVVAGVVPARALVIVKAGRHTLEVACPDMDLSSLHANQPVHVKGILRRNRGPAEFVVQAMTLEPR